jgi:deoxyribodipyrimidine photo-lyase
MTEKGVLVFLKELVWREFAYHLLFHFPHTSKLPMRPEFESFPWAEDRDSLQVWQQGLTGYPIVDAGMRQLWQVGWMHNRVRMIVASFLVKDLLVPWQKGAAWFWDTLVDADLSSNSMGWQWVAGCGADAAPYFRVFNPYLQGEKFDGDGLYVKRWCPELQHLPAKWVHRPGDAPAEVLKKAGIQLGKDYPLPIVDHQAAKMRALQAYEAIKGKFNHLPRLTDK